MPSDSSSKAKIARRGTNRIASLYAYSLIEVLAYLLVANRINPSNREFEKGTSPRIPRS